MTIGFNRLPSQSYLVSKLHYDHLTGAFTYKAQAGDDVDIKTWNARFAGRRAGGISGKNGRYRIRIRGIKYAAHRIAYKIMTGEDPPEIIDHINGIATDNRWCNLRSATHSQNLYNSGPRRDNNTGVRGVTRFGKRFTAYILVDGKKRPLGSFPTLDLAADAYRAAAMVPTR